MAIRHFRNRSNSHGKKSESLAEIEPMVPGTTQEDPNPKFWKRLWREEGGVGGGRGGEGSPVGSSPKPSLDPPTEP